MIGLVIALIAYLVAGTGYFGGDLVYAMDVLENWYIFVLVIVSILAFIIFLVFAGVGTSVGHDISRKYGAFGGLATGSVLGAIFAALIVMKTALQLWLVVWLMNSVDPSAIDLDALSNKQMIAGAMIVILAFIPGFSFSSDKNKKE